jgi:hypothetical protein
MSPFISTASDVSAYVVQIDDYSRSKSVKDGSAAQGENRQEVLNRLEEISEECSRLGWDGDSAVPISAPLQKVARVLIQSLPSNLEDPDLGVELDGSVTLEWRRSQTKVISISISPDNSLYFAALLDGIRKRAAYPFQTTFPNDLLRVVNEVVSV